MEKQSINNFVNSLPESIRGSLSQFIKDSKYNLRSIQQYFKELGKDYSVAEILDWLKAITPSSEKVRYLQSITEDAEGIRIEESLQYLFMRGLHISISLLDRLEIEAPEDPEKIGKLAKGMLQETTRLGQIVLELKRKEESKDLVLGTATEVIELMQRSFEGTQYEDFYLQSANHALKLIETRSGL